MKVPKFEIFGLNDSKIEQSIQPLLEMRCWGDLSREEKQKAFQYCKNNSIFDFQDWAVICAVDHLNHNFLRERPGEELAAAGPTPARDRRFRAAIHDFEKIFISHENTALVMRMLSVFASTKIDNQRLKFAESADTEEIANEFVEDAFSKFDYVAQILNHVLEQFAVNLKLTRSGLIPLQDKVITETIFEPTLRALSGKEWSPVSETLNEMFSDFQDRNFDDAILKGHNAVQQFLQIAVGEEGKNGKGQFGRLISEAKKHGIISSDQFSQQIVSLFQSFLASERANKSPAKPTDQTVTSADAVLVMNVVVVFIQHCLLQKNS